MLVSLRVSVSSSDSQAIRAPYRQDHHNKMIIDRIQFYLDNPIQ